MLSNKSILISCLVFLLFFNHISYSQSDSTDHYKSRKKILLLGTGSTYLASMSALSLAWYKDFDQSSFHFHNDNKEWLLMDKVGHTTSSYYLSNISFKATQWAGIAPQKGIWFAGLSSLFFMSSIELFDGFSEEWGASYGDLIANTTGSALFISQQLLWKEQRLLLKWSYSNSSYAQYRPNILGASFNERWLKDYNGQTYWLSANLSSFFKQNKQLPSWLNIAFGYGANGMLGGHQNPTEYEGDILPQFTRYRQFYISPDIKLSQFKGNKKGLNTLIDLFSFLKIPLPTLEYNTLGQWKFHLIHF